MDGDFLVLENPESGERVRILETIRDGQTQIAPEGRLTMEMAHDLEDELTSMVLMCNDVTLQLQSVEYISNSVIRMILEIQHMVDGRNGSLKIRGVKDHLWNRFEEMGLEDVFDMERI